VKQWVVVVGGTNMDVVARTSSPLVAATSNPGHTRISPGGVGRNVAACLGLLGAPVRLVSAVGDDAFGDEALRVTAACGADVTAVRRAPGATGTYTAVLDDRGELVAAVSDMAIVDELQLETVHLTDAALVVLDGNLAHAQAARVVAAAAEAGVPLAFEPVSVAKAGRLADLVHDLFLVTPNEAELVALGPVAELHRRGVEVVWVRRGAAGSSLSLPPEHSVVGPDRARRPSIELEAPTVTPVDVTGAGDAMLAAFCHHLLAGAPLDEAARAGYEAAALTVASPHTVRPDLGERMGR